MQHAHQGSLIPQHLERRRKLLQTCGLTEEGLGRAVQDSVVALKRNLTSGDGRTEVQAAKILSELALGLIREGQAQRGTGGIKVVVNAQTHEGSKGEPSIDITPAGPGAAPN